MSRGAALPVVLLAMTMASALAVGGVYVARGVAASARLSQRGAALQPSAESVLVEAVANWDSLAWSDQPVGSVVSVTGVSSSGTQTDAWITRLGEHIYWLVAESSTPVRPGLRRRIGLLVTVSGGFPTAVPQRGWTELP